MEWKRHIQIQEFFISFSSLLTIENLQNHFIFKILNSNQFSGQVGLGFCHLLVIRFQFEITWIFIWKYMNIRGGKKKPKTSLFCVAPPTMCMESCLSITNGDKFKGPYLFMGIFSSMPFSFPSLLIPRIILILGFLGAYVLKHLASKRTYLRELLQQSHTWQKH